MLIERFYELVMADEEFSLHGATPEGGCFYLKHPLTDACWIVDPRDVEANVWELLRAIFVGRELPQCLQHMTRIVGYYSIIENWNKSKLGELRDRRKGQYAVPERRVA